MEFLFFVATFLFSLIGFQTSLWILFEHNQMPGWKSLVPFYNLFCLSSIAGKKPSENWKWFVPFYNVFFFYQVNSALVKKYRKSAELTYGLTFFFWAFYPILAIEVIDWMDKSIYSRFCGPLPLFGPANGHLNGEQKAA